jgi:hypothetical protein
MANDGYLHPKLFQPIKKGKRETRNKTPNLSPPFCVSHCKLLADSAIKKNMVVSLKLQPDFAFSACLPSFDDNNRKLGEMNASR